MKAVISVGVTILVIECTWLAYWLASGIAVWIVAATDGGREYLDQHAVAGGFHIPATITLCLVLEHYRALLRERGARKTRTESSDASGARLRNKPAYLASWAIGMGGTFVSDLLSLASVTLLSPGEAPALFAVEAVLSSWALFGTLCATAWSIWIYAKIAKTERKLAQTPSDFRRQWKQ